MPGLLRGVARTAVVAGTATAVSNRVSRRQGQRWAAQQAPPQYESAPQYEPAPPPPAAQAPAATGTVDRISALKQLGELKAQGVLTEEEFAAEKAKILAS
ncbi:SHOCT domain-containing protein [Rhodococcus hoagii]|nr:SHOCT domain-containing protein [Prescottella equi]